MRCFLLMLSFFTRIPIKIKGDIKEEDMYKGMKYFPLVGLILGIISGGFFYLFSLVFSKTISVILVTLVSILLTGALHIDGLADTCDGIFSARKKDEMLRIMKDSRLGTNGVIAVIFDVLFKMALYLSLSNKNIIIALVLANTISKTMMLFSCFISSYARKEGGLGSSFIGKVNSSTLLVGLSFGTIVSAVLINYRGLILIFLCASFIWFYNKYINKKIGGITGDILGSINEISEIFVLLFLVIFIRFNLL